jgi:hypothetical protein
MVIRKGESIGEICEGMEDGRSDRKGQVKSAEAEGMSIRTMAKNKKRIQPTTKNGPEKTKKKVEERGMEESEQST